jgi:hypothetical protein
MGPREVAGALAELLVEYLGRRLDEPGLAGKLRTLADQLGAPEAPAPVSQPRENELEVFGYWQRTLSKSKAKFTPERRAKVRARLREGYTVEQIKRAIDGVASSPFHRGENTHHREYTDLTLICQTGSKLEGFLDLGGATLVSVRGDDTKESRLELLRAQARRQLAAGETSAYAETESKIRELTGGGAGVRREPRGHASQRGGAGGEPGPVSVARGLARATREPHP